MAVPTPLSRGRWLFSLFCAPTALSSAAENQRFWWCDQQNIGQKLADPSLFRAVSPCHAGFHCQLSIASPRA
jgi:hypothetical protein